MKITNNNLRTLFHGDMHTDIFYLWKLWMLSILTHLCKKHVAFTLLEKGLLYKF